VTLAFRGTTMLALGAGSRGSQQSKSRSCLCGTILRSEAVPADQHSLTHVQTHVHMRTHTHTRAHNHTHSCFTHLLTFSRTHSPTHTHTPTRTHTHTPIHTHTPTPTHPHNMLAATHRAAPLPLHHVPQPHVLVAGDQAGHRLCGARHLCV